MTSHLQNMSNTEGHAEFNIHSTKTTVGENMTSSIYELSTSPQLTIPETGFIIIPHETISFD